MNFSSIDSLSFGNEIYIAFEIAGSERLNSSLLIQKMAENETFKDSNACHLE